MNFGIIVAGGKSERMGPGVDKAFLSLGTKPVLAHSLLAFEKCPDIDGVILVVRRDRLDSAQGMAKMFGCAKVKAVVVGGKRRQDSVAKGLAELSDDVKLVSVHDGARPCVTPEIISATLASAKRYGSGVAAVKITDTVKMVKRGMTISETMDRSKLWAVQTPQSFKVALLLSAFAAVKKKNKTVTDEASAVELVSDKVRLVQASLSNVKITAPEDLIVAAALLDV